MKPNEKEKTLEETKFCTTSLSTPLHARLSGSEHTTPLSFKKKIEKLNKDHYVF